MRWPIVRLIAYREARDQIRDRRTMFLILGLPLLMYPLFIGVGTVFVAMLKDKKLVVGVVRAEQLPKPGVSIAPLAGGAAEAALQMKQFPPLVVDDRFVDKYLPEDPENAAGGKLIYKSVPIEDESLLAHRQVDALLIVDPDFAAKLERGERPAIRILGRDGEENSKLAVRRVTGVLRKWAADVKTARFARAGLAPDFDSPVDIRDPQTGKSNEKKMADELRDVLVKVIPMLLVMWVLTGAIYPAIDMTAGEKERGTMETLLISPAERTEIVAGKFLAVTVLCFCTAIWNVMLMVGAVAVAQLFLKSSLLSLGGLAACVLAALPIAMLFAASCLTLGVFARSTKEGNYYMVPMFFLVLPLAYWSMAPGIELDAAMSWVPVTNALLLQQRLMAVRPDPFPWQHVPAVVISMSACIALALFAVVRQFHREAVLFREAEASSRRKWRLFGRK
ncbi:MAG TPA: ABC transporter permease subunit [Urbifossiella sp.]|nr:ABC transporter permease subunit [Urbifossiella sp.]